MLAVGVVFAVATPAMGVLVDLAGHWSAPVVGLLEAKGLISGDQQGRFRPEEPLTRAELAKLFVLALGRGADAQTLARVPSRFSDVPSWHWARGYIESFAELAITSGYPDGRFGPADTVTRAQLAVFLTRALGLENEVRSRNQAPTAFTDDAHIPAWARGAVQTALTHGLITGYEDGTFRANQAVTRAEGSMALFRLLTVRGDAFHLAGTLVRFDPVTLQGLVRDPSGAEKPIIMRQDAAYYRAGLSVAGTQVQPLDQVWIALDDKGQGTFMEARYQDMVGTDAVYRDGTLWMKLNDGTFRTFPMQPGALIFINSRQSNVSRVDQASQAYAILDQTTGEVRVLDLVQTSVEGKVVLVSSVNATVTLNVDKFIRTYQVSPDAFIWLDGRRIGLFDLREGDTVAISVDADGVLDYAQVKRGD